MQLKTTRISLNSELGNQIVQTYEGPFDSLQSWLTEQVDYQSLDIDRVEPAEGGSLVRVTITRPATAQGELPPPNFDGQLRLVWVLQGVDEQLEMEAHPKVVALDDAYPGWSQLVRTYVRAFQDSRRKKIEEWDFGSGNPQLPTWRIPVPPGVNDPNLIADAELYANLLLSNDRPTYQVSRWVLRKQQTVTHKSTLQVAHQNINRYFSAATLLATEPTLANAMRFNVNEVINAYIWQKKSPEITATWGANYELIQEYWSSAIPPIGSLAQAFLVFTYDQIL